MEKQSVWTQNIYIRTFETDFENRWKPAGFFQAIQETATAHATNMGFDYHDMIAQNQIFILSRVKIKFYAFPGMRETVNVKTWPVGIQQKVFFTRDFYFTTQDGTRFASATTAWILIDPSARRMLLPSALKGELPYHDERALDETLQKIVPRDDLPKQLQVTAGYSAIDMMSHVNNARYIEWICDCFPHSYYQSHQLDWLQINYLNEARPGDQISLAAGPCADDPLEWAVKATNLTSANWTFEAALKWTAR